MLTGDAGRIFALLVEVTAHDGAFDYTLKWLPIVLPVTLALLGAIWRGVNAKERIRKKYEDDLRRVADSTRAASVATVAGIVARVHPLMTWPRAGFGGLRRGDPGDPETEVARRLAGRQFSGDLTSLETYGAAAREAASAKERIARTEHACAWLFGLLLVPWLYFVFWASTTGLPLPHGLTVGALAVGMLLSGAIVTLKVLEQREVGRLSDVVESCGKTPVDDEDADA